MLAAKPSEAECTEVSITGLLRETIDLMRAQAILNDVLIEQVNTEINVIIIGDAEQLKQLFINLICNAIEATTKANARIRVLVEIAQAAIVISVEDEGIGIPKANMWIRRLFKIVAGQADGTA